jgi:hypothetical protein
MLPTLVSHLTDDEASVAVPLYDAGQGGDDEDGEACASADVAVDENLFGDDDQLEGLDDLDLEDEEGEEEEDDDDE